MKTPNIIFSAGLDAYHCLAARQDHDEKSLVMAIADQFHDCGSFPSYSAAVVAAAGVLQYQAMLATGKLMLRQARLNLDAGIADGIPCLNANL